MLINCDIWTSTTMHDYYFTHNCLCSLECFQKSTSDLFELSLQNELFFGKESNVHFYHKPTKMFFRELQICQNLTKLRLHRSISQWCVRLQWILVRILDFKVNITLKRLKAYFTRFPWKIPWNWTSSLYSRCSRQRSQIWSPQKMKLWVGGEMG